MMDTGLQTTKIMRTKVLHGMNITIAFSAFVLAIINAAFEKYTVAAFEFVLATICIIVYASIKRNAMYKTWHLISIPAFFTTTVTVALLNLDIQGGIIYWIYTFPVLFYLLFGTSYGFSLSVILLVLQTLVIYYRLDNADQLKWSIFVNMYLTYTIIISIAHVFEKYRASSQNQLIELTVRDPLTNAYNRLGLKKHFQQFPKTQCSISLALIDIDFFKKINDTYGHNAGDFILVEFIAICQRAVGEEQVFRLGGEEFVLLINGTPEHGIKTINALRETIEQTTFEFSHDMQLTITFSAGVIHMQELNVGKGDMLSRMITVADERLYHAKNAGRNTVIAT